MMFAYLVTFCLGGVASQLVFDMSVRNRAKEFFKALTSPRTPADNPCAFPVEILLNNDKKSD